MQKIYIQCTAAVLRAKDCVMKTVTNIQENAEDIYSEAMQINEERASENSEFDDESETEVENDTMKTEEQSVETDTCKNDAGVFHIC